MKREKGYYWVNWADMNVHSDRGSFVGYYDGSNYLPWQIIACDEILREDELIVFGDKIKNYYEEGDQEID